MQFVWLARLGLLVVCFVGDSANSFLLPSVSRLWNPGCRFSQGVPNRLGRRKETPISMEKMPVHSWERRDLLKYSLSFSTIMLPTTSRGEVDGGGLVKVTDPESYSALAYAPSGAQGKLPLVLVLHGAGQNEKDVWNLADPRDEHAGLAPSLLSSGKAPRELAENFAVIAPYSQGKKSFYEEPRKKLLRFVEWVCSDAGQKAGCPNVDPNRIFLFGFSDGATVGIELLTTRRFAGAIIAAYGFTGELPSKAKERLKGIPVWVFHSADDVIFDVANSDRLVSALRKVDGRDDLVRYTRFDRDQEGFTGPVQGHSTGITATRTSEVYKWLLSL